MNPQEPRKNTPHPPPTDVPRSTQILAPQTHPVGWDGTLVTIGKRYRVEHDDCCGSVTFKLTLKDIRLDDDGAVSALVFEHGVIVTDVGDISIEEMPERQWDP